MSTMKMVIRYTVTRKERLEMTIDDYMTPNEASYRWGINQETVKNKLKPSLNKKEIEGMEKEGLIKSFVRPNGKRKEWIISKEAMYQWFGNPKK